MSSDDWRDPERHWGDYGDDDVQEPSLRERKTGVENMVAFGKKHGREDLAQIGDQLIPIIDECIKKEEEVNALTEENQKTLTANEELLEDIKKQMEELEELEKEIADELDELAKELEAALNSDPQDPALIAKLQQRQAELTKLQQECQADRKNLEKCYKQSTQISQQCKEISTRCDTVRERANSPDFGGSAASNYFYRGSNSSNNANRSETNPSSYYQGEEMSPEETCDFYAEAMRNLITAMTELRDYMVKEVEEIKELSTSNSELLQETKKELEVTSQNIQSRREKFNEMRNERAKNLEASPAANQQAVSLTSPVRTQNPNISIQETSREVGSKKRLLDEPVSNEHAHSKPRLN